MNRKTMLFLLCASLLVTASYADSDVTAATEEPPAKPAKRSERRWKSHKITPEQRAEHKSKRKKHQRELQNKISAITDKELQNNITAQLEKMREIRKQMKEVTPEERKALQAETRTIHDTLKQLFSDAGIEEKHHEGEGKKGTYRHR